MNPERYPPLYRWRPYAWRKSIIGSDPDKVAYDLLIRKSEDLLFGSDPDKVAYDLLIRKSEGENTL